MNANEKESYKIQMLRGLAIIAVVFIHNTPNGLGQVLCRPFLNFSVGLFLFLSGLLSTRDKWNPLRRIKKVMIPYISWNVIYAIIYNIKVPDQIPIQFVKYIFLGNGAAIMYYIWVYCEFTLLIPMIDKMAKSKWKYCGFLISPLEIIIMRLLPLILNINMNKYIYLLMNISCLGWFIYYYLGYLLGNGILNVKIKTNKLIYIYIVSVVLQVVEGYLYLKAGAENYGTQLKITAIFTGIIVVIISYRFIVSNKLVKSRILKMLGDNSFGIFFSHLAIMSVLNHLPYYSECVYPVNAMIVVLSSLICVVFGHKILKKYGRYLAL